MKNRASTDTQSPEIQRIMTSEAMLRQAQAVAKVGSWAWDLVSDKVTWSEQMYRQYGLDPETYEPTFDSLLQYVHPDDKERVMSLTRQAQETHAPSATECRIVRPNGDIRWVYAQGVVETEKGQPVRLFGVQQDITEQKQHSERFKALLDATPDPIMLVDRQGLIQYVNAKVKAVFGYEKGDLVGTAADDLVPNATGQAKRPGMRPKRKTQTTEQAMSRHKDGREFPVELWRSQLRWDGKPMTMVAVRDVSERKQAEEADRLAFERLMEIQQLKQFNDARAEIFNAMSHELKTPLTPLRIQLRLLQMDSTGTLNESQRNSVDMMARSVERLNDLISDVLDVSRIESGTFDLAQDELDFSEVMQDLDTLYSPLCKQHGIRWTMNTEAPLAMVGDAGRLSQVAINLASNAAKFTPRNGHIDVSARKDGDAIVVEIKDDGLGIRPEDHDKLFQPFGQVHEPGESPERGTGLGLSICKSIIEAHGGTIGVRSQGKGKGSTFWFRVPTGPLP